MRKHCGHRSDAHKGAQISSKKSNLFRFKYAPDGVMLVVSGRYVIARS